VIYRPTERSTSRDRERATRELAGVLVALAVSAALVVQFACTGADPIAHRWLCPNNARLARLTDPAATITSTVSATPETGTGIWTQEPDLFQPPPTPVLDDFGAPEVLFATLPPPDPFDAFPTARPTPPLPAPITTEGPFDSPAMDDRTTAILGTATALSATATARAERAADETPEGIVFPPPGLVTTTPHDGGYP